MERRKQEAEISRQTQQSRGSVLAHVKNRQTKRGASTTLPHFQARQQSTSAFRSLAPPPLCTRPPPHWHSSSDSNTHAAPHAYLGPLKTGIAKPCVPPMALHIVQKVGHNNPGDDVANSLGLGGGQALKRHPDHLPLVVKGRPAAVTRVDGRVHLHAQQLRLTMAIRHHFHPAHHASSHAHCITTNGVAIVLEKKERREQIKKKGIEESAVARVSTRSRHKSQTKCDTTKHNTAPFPRQTKSTRSLCSLPSAPSAIHPPPPLALDQRQQPTL